MQLETFVLWELFDIITVKILKKYFSSKYQQRILYMVPATLVKSSYSSSIKCFSDYIVSKSHTYIHETLQISLIPCVYKSTCCCLFRRGVLQKNEFLNFYLSLIKFGHILFEFLEGNSYVSISSQHTATYIEMLRFGLN